MAKQQHYVAQAYLRPFAAEAGKHPKVWCYDKTIRGRFKSNLRNVAGENYFYHLPSDVGQPAEQFFAAIESDFVGARDAIAITDATLDIPAGDRATLAYFVATQMIRTREHRAGLVELGTALTDLLGHKVPPDERNAFAAEDDARMQQLYQIATGLPSDLANILIAMKWMVATNGTGMPFWTSDAPVVLHNDISSPLRGNLGLRCRGIQLFLPLAPNLTLMMVDPEMFKTLPSVITVDTENVKFMNDLALRSAWRYVFSATGDFVLADSILDVHPELSDRRSRIAIASPPGLVRRGSGKAASTE